MSREQYLDRVIAVLHQNFRVNDSTGSMTAASAAYVVKHKAGDHAVFGFPKFKDVLDALEGRGEIRQGTNSKHALAIWLDRSPRPVSLHPQVRSSHRLRKDVWFAFVASEPSGQRFLHPRSGQIQVGCVEALPEPWVEIETIDSEKDKARAHEFLEQHKLDDNAFAAELHSATWYSDFPKKLHELRPDLVADWNRSRSAWVASHVLEWCKSNNVRLDCVFQVNAADSAAASPSDVGTGDGLREALLEAISQLSTEELLQIRVPAANLIAALRPDLVR